LYGLRLNDLGNTTRPTAATPRLRT